MKKIMIHSDFNVSLLAQQLSLFLSNEWEVVKPSYGTLHQSILSNQSGEKQATSIIWASMEAISPQVSSLLNHEGTSVDDVLQDVNEWIEVIREYAQSQRYVVVVTPFYLNQTTGQAVFTLNTQHGSSYLLAKVKVLLAEAFGQSDNMVLLDCHDWFVDEEQACFSARRWFSAKMPFSGAFSKRVAQQLVTTVESLEGKSRKLLLLDLDNTLWGGIVGDDGWQGLVLGENHSIGEAFLAFQKAILALKRQGIQLGIVSKNTEACALEAIQKHPDMVLKLSDFVAWRINWQDKATNIQSIVDELNIGLDAVVFIDDNVHERQWVKQALPDVLVPDWPEDPCSYLKAFNEIRCFASPLNTQEDQNRSVMYEAEKNRQGQVNQFASLEAWLASLNIQVSVHFGLSENEARIVQLMNKSNQMNLTTHRCSLAELKAWEAENHHHLMSFSVNDKYGDYGLVGIIGCEIVEYQEQSELLITDFILSCRAMGKGIEKVMIHQLTLLAKEMRCAQLKANFLPTDRNQPCLEWLRSEPTKEREEHQFSWNNFETYPCPDHISIVS